MVPGKGTDSFEALYLKFLSVSGMRGKVGIFKRGESSMLTILTDSKKLEKIAALDSSSMNRSWRDVRRYTFCTI